MARTLTLALIRLVCLATHKNPDSITNIAPPPSLCLLFPPPPPLSAIDTVYFPHPPNKAGLLSACRGELSVSAVSCVRILVDGGCSARGWVLKSCVNLHPHSPIG